MRMEFSWLPVFLILLVEIIFGKDLTSLPGHLKPFGEGGLNHPLEEIDYFPTAEEFFENYVKPLKPVKMKGAAKMSPAFEKWTDDYFLTLDEPSDHHVSLETRKKESRQQEMDSMQFKEFVKIYNQTEYYMVDAVPKFLRHDIMIPCPLQCRQLVQNEFVDNVMWYSSGGTSSVVHTDSVENINCLYRGNKTLTFVDPDKYGDKVDLDRIEGGYSTMDVDSVDYTKFPGMAEVEFYHVNVTAGDCLYIPYLWIHQVRSYGSNLAVNIWWKHHLSHDLDYSGCSDPCNPEMTLEEASFEGFGDLESHPHLVKEHFRRLLGNSKEMDITKFTNKLVGAEMAGILKQNEEAMEALDEIFSLLDADKDAVVTLEEVDSAPEEVMLEVSDILQAVEEEVEKMYNDMEMDIDNKEEGPDEYYQGDSDEMDKHDEL